MAASRVLVTNYLDILDNLNGKFETNIDYDRINDLVKFQLFYNPDWSIEQVSLNGIDSSNYTYTFGKARLYVMEPIVSTIENAKNKIKDVRN